MGENANEIFKICQLTEEDQVYETVNRRFETHFVGRTNVIFERARFNRELKAHRNPWSILLKASMHTR